MSLSSSYSAEEIEVIAPASNGPQSQRRPPARPRPTRAASSQITAKTYAQDVSDFSDDIPAPNFSDSSADIGIISRVGTQQSKGESRSNSIGNSSELGGGAAGTEVEPDWVRAYTPKRADKQDEKEAFLASLDDEDDDSVIDLISQEVGDNVSAETEKVGEAEKAASQSAKRGKGAKPKSRLPLVVAPKLDDNLVLLQSEGKGLDLSGDVGAVGRVKVQDGELLMDIKGVVYRGCVGKCNTMCVVNVGDEEARVTAVLDEAVTLTCERNLFDSDEIVVHGQLDEHSVEGGGLDFRDEDVVRSSKKRKTSEANPKSRGKVSANGKGAESGKRTSKGGRRKK